MTLPVSLGEDGLVTDAQVWRLREKRMSGKTLEEDVREDVGSGRGGGRDERAPAAPRRFRKRTPHDRTAQRIATARCGTARPVDAHSASALNPEIGEAGAPTGRWKSSG